MNIPLYANTPNFMQIFPTLLRHSINWLKTSPLVFILLHCLHFFLRSFLLFSSVSCYVCYVYSPWFPSFSLFLLVLRFFLLFFLFSLLLSFSCSECAVLEHTYTPQQPFTPPSYSCNCTTFLYGQDCTSSFPLPTILLHRRLCLWLLVLLVPSTMRTLSFSLATRTKSSKKLYYLCVGLFKSASLR
jgi:hypothetical protein